MQSGRQNPLDGQDRAHPRSAPPTKVARRQTRSNQWRKADRLRPLKPRTASAGRPSGCRCAGLRTRHAPDGAAPRTPPPQTRMRQGCGGSPGSPPEPASSQPHHERAEARLPPRGAAGRVQHACAPHPQRPPSAHSPRHGRTPASARSRCGRLACGGRSPPGHPQRGRATGCLARPARAAARTRQPRPPAERRAAGGDPANPRRTPRPARRPAPVPRARAACRSGGRTLRPIPASRRPRPWQRRRRGSGTGNALPPARRGAAREWWR